MDKSGSPGHRGRVRYTDPLPEGPAHGNIYNFNPCTLLPDTLVRSFVLLSDRVFRGPNAERTTEQDTQVHNTRAKARVSHALLHRVRDAFQSFAVHELLRELRVPLCTHPVAAVQSKCPGTPLAPADHRRHLVRFAARLLQSRLSAIPHLVAGAHGNLHWPGHRLPVVRPDPVLSVAAALPQGRHVEDLGAVAVA